jgi:hypothetical protein
LEIPYAKPVGLGICEITAYCLIKRLVRMPTNSTTGLLEAWNLIGGVVEKFLRILAE